MSTEDERLAADGAAWRRWGPYLSERAWGTVREDYSADGTAWTYFPHDHARSRAYRWSEDGLAGISDDQQRLCFAWALWNGRDPILKERLFGLSGPEGNHGEDVKEYYFYLDATPTYSWMQMLYKYPQAAFPYAELVEENRRRGRHDPELELIDTGVFDGSRYFDVLVEYAKATPGDILIRLSASNRGPAPAALHCLPTLWFRNTWSWGDVGPRPALVESQISDGPGGRHRAVHARHPTLGDHVLSCPGADELLFTENETNATRLWKVPSASAAVKDAFHEAVIHCRRDALATDRGGTKAAARYVRMIAPGATETLRLRLTRIAPGAPATADPLAGFDATMTLRRQEADEFYAARQCWAAPHPDPATLDRMLIQRRALASLLWSRQFYQYEVKRWLDGDPGQPTPPAARRRGRNHAWTHLNLADVISMPDKWEYPWFAAWDHAFHAVALARVDPEFAKQQLLLLGAARCAHPNGQIPAYEWALGDVNPPVLAWAAWRVYRMDRARNRHGDRAFLERVFHKQLLFFTWWVNRKDQDGRNIFEGGFLGLDNIEVFDRSAPLPTGGYIEQSDGTSWMSMFCLDMMQIALELAREDSVYEDIAVKFFEHFLYIAAAMAGLVDNGISLWDETDGFFYDVLRLPDGRRVPLRAQSMVGLIPLFAVVTIEPETLEALPCFGERLEWFLAHRPDLAGLVSRWHVPGTGDRRLVALVRGHRMKLLLRRALDPAAFLSDGGVRSLSKRHAAEPFVLDALGQQFVVGYEPAESQSGAFGGNSNWRGPVWFPLNYLLIEALRRFHHYYGDDFRVECPTGSGHYLTLAEIADELSRRLIGLFARNAAGQRPVLGAPEVFQRDPEWRDHLRFHEYFHGDTGAGLGAGQQTGWTALVALLIEAQGRPTR
ncbi:MAG: glucosidase [Candidatus Rokubacteria bacterium]|nr:glucosidase [Candidatus Rokubacteria bacterium]